MIDKLKADYYVIDEDGLTDREVVKKVNEIIDAVNSQQYQQDISKTQTTKDTSKKKFINVLLIIIVILVSVYVFCTPLHL